MGRAPEYPLGWDEQRVREVLAHYESQSEEEAVAEDEASLGARGTTTVEVPHELLGAVREMIASHRSGREPMSHQRNSKES